VTVQLPRRITVAAHLARQGSCVRCTVKLGKRPKPPRVQMDETGPTKFGAEDLAAL